MSPNIHYLQSTIAFALLYSKTLFSGVGVNQSRHKNSLNIGLVDVNKTTVNSGLGLKICHGPMPRQSHQCWLLGTNHSLQSAVPTRQQSNVQYIIPKKNLKLYYILTQFVRENVRLFTSTNLISPVLTHICKHNIQYQIFWQE